MLERQLNLNDTLLIQNNQNAQTVKQSQSQSTNTAVLELQDVPLLNLSNKCVNFKVIKTNIDGLLVPVFKTSENDLFLPEPDDTLTLINDLESEIYLYIKNHRRRFRGFYLIHQHCPKTNIGVFNFVHLNKRTISIYSVDTNCSIKLFGRDFSLPIIHVSFEKFRNETNEDKKLILTKQNNLNLNDKNKLYLKQRFCYCQVKFETVTDVYKFIFNKLNTVFDPNYIRVLLTTVLI